MKGETNKGTPKKIQIKEKSSHKHDLSWLQPINGIQALEHINKEFMHRAFKLRIECSMENPPPTPLGKWRNPPYRAHKIPTPRKRRNAPRGEHLEEGFTEKHPC